MFGRNDEALGRLESLRNELEADEKDGAITTVLVLGWVYSELAEMVAESSHDYARMAVDCLSKPELAGFHESTRIDRLNALINGGGR